MTVSNTTGNGGGTPPPAPRRIVWFSCGAASAVAAKLTIDRDASACIVYCDTSKTEHPDNARFRTDVEKWIDRSVVVIRSERYETVDDVIEQRRYMSGPKGALCTTEMKKMPRFAFQRPDDIHIFGFTADEDHRIKRFKKGNPELFLEWPLVEQGINKDRCYEILGSAGIELPMMYRLGYDHNNCLGCVKSQSPAYWNKIRRDFPEVFQRRCRQSRELGVKLVTLHGERIFLYDLPPDEAEAIQENLSCGPECGNV